ncbi:MAG TPA: hemolysin family protein [Acidimicrobiales bacterium]|nr:hemolysin family protein [Acidimicrobiales bacterium]
MSTGELALLAALVVLLLGLVFLALAETGLTRMTRARATALRDEGRKGAASLMWLVSHPEDFINPLLLVVLVVQSVQTALTTLLAEELFGGAGVAVGLFVNVVVVFVLAEAAPKTWAVQHPESAGLVAARPVRALARFWPLRLVSRGLIGLTNVVLPGRGLEKGPWVSEDELLAFAEEAEESEAIDPEERVLIRRILEFGDTIVRSVMIPRTDMVGVPADFRAVDVMEVVLLNGYSRVPVYDREKGVDDVVGLVYARDLMRVERDGRGGEPVADLMREARFVPETKRVAELLREMQAEQFHMAIAVDEFGGTAGLVTLEDLIEELVGEIVDEFDVEDARVEPLPGGDFRVNARLTIDDAEDLLGIHLPEGGDVDTVGGVLIQALGHVPAEGDEVEVEGVRLRAERVQGRRVLRVRVIPPRPALPGPHDDGRREAR